MSSAPRSRIFLKRRNKDERMGIAMLTAPSRWGIVRQAIGEFERSPSGLVSLAVLFRTTSCSGDSRGSPLTTGSQAHSSSHEVVGLSSDRDPSLPKFALYSLPIATSRTRGTGRSICSLPCLDPTGSTRSRSVAGRPPETSQTNLYAQHCPTRPVSGVPGASAMRTIRHEI